MSIQKIQLERMRELAIEMATLAEKIEAGDAAVPVAMLGFSSRALNCLQRGNIKCLGFADLGFIKEAASKLRQAKEFCQ